MTISILTQSTVTVCGIPSVLVEGYPIAAFDIQAHGLPTVLAEGHPLVVSTTDQDGTTTVVSRKIFDSPSDLSESFHPV